MFISIIGLDFWMDNCVWGMKMARDYQLDFLEIPVLATIILAIYSVGILQHITRLVNILMYGDFLASRKLF